MSRTSKTLILVGLVMLLALAACAPPAAPSAPAAPTTAPEAAQPTAAPETKPAVAENLNIAVIVKAVTSDYWKTVGAGVEAAMKTDPVDHGFLPRTQRRNRHRRPDPHHRVADRLQGRCDRGGALAGRPGPADPGEGRRSRHPRDPDRHRHHRLHQQGRLRRHRQQARRPARR